MGYYGGKIKEILSPILRKVEEYDRMLKEIKENNSMLNHAIAYHSISIKL